MFSIAAINDTDSKSQWEPLAPTKEAQEFHLSQTYHEGLLKLQAKEYEKARELLESVLKDPLIANAQVDSCASDGHLLQLRFLALKNLASVFLQQGSAHYENALHCYLQAVEIDSKDSVIWNQLGTLSCSMGSLSISRWAFEQGLLCSPNNWNCMEKLLEVLIAIGDEVACLSVAELILRHWPSHSRALHVKNTIEETEPLPFAPRGIDKLEPKHVRLKFPDKRKATNENLDEDVAFKKLNQNIELHLTEASWVALVDALLEILLPLNGKSSETEPEKASKSGDIRLSIQLSCSEVGMNSVDKKGSSGEIIAFGDGNIERSSSFKEKEVNTQEEQPHERRSSRLERLRSRKPGKEESDSACGKDHARVVIQYLEPFIAGGLGGRDSLDTTTSSNVANAESSNVSRFVRESSKNYGAYHMAHLLLEEIAGQNLIYQDAFVKFLELEKLMRHWGKERTAECSLFLAELYYDFGLCFPRGSKQSKFMSEASYHLCKIIESVALDYPFHLTNDLKNEGCSLVDSFQKTCRLSTNTFTESNSSLDGSLLMKNSSLWVRFFWLSGRLSNFESNKTKACEELCSCLSLLAKRQNMNNSQCSVCRPHCKAIKDLSIDRVLYEINMLKVIFLMEKSVTKMVEKEMYLECVTLLSPLLFSTQDVYIDSLSLTLADKKDEKITLIELMALDVLIEACQKIKPMDVEMYLNCHHRKLQVLMAMTRLNECLTSFKSSHQTLGINTTPNFDTDSKESSSKLCSHLVAEVKALSDCVSQVKKVIDHRGESNSLSGPMSNICQIQSLLLSIMSYFANIIVCNKASAIVISDQAESSCFVDAAIIFCKLQHFNPNIPIKTQVDLIVATHDLLAEYGLCCAGEGGKGEEGTFLRFAIKHLLALDMKLKSSFNPVKKEPVQCEKVSQNSLVNVSIEESKSYTLDLQMDQAKIDEISSMQKDVFDGILSKRISTCEVQEKDSKEVEGENLGGSESDSKFNRGEILSNHLVEFENELTEDEREELESKIDNALDQCFFCLYGLNLRSDSSYEDDIVMHKNTSRGDYQTKEQCADVFKYVLPYAKASSRTGLVKLRRVLRAIRKHFLQPPEDVLAGNPIDNFLDDPDLGEDNLSDEAGSNGFLETIIKIMFPDTGGLTQYNTSLLGRSEPYLEVYCNLYYFLALSEEMSATDKWPGFVLTKEGEEFVEQNANLFKYDLMYNPLRFESWQRLANIYDEEVDLLLNDGSKHINVAGWRKNATLPERVETSRRRSRRCLLMSLALAKTSAQQCEIHELLALVYYDSLQNVVPFYDQRSILPSKDAAWMMFCDNSMKHFKKAFILKEDWLHAFYLGKLSEKLGYSHEIALSYYNKAIALNMSAVDPVYRMHASRLKLLFKCGKQNLEILKVLSANSFNQSSKEVVMSILGEMDGSSIITERCIQVNSVEIKHEGLLKLDKAWSILYNDCISALETCVEGDLKHYHKARYMLAQGLYKRGESGDVERAKDQLSFCFKSSRSSFTINMWEIDSMAKKGRRKTPGSSGNKKALEVNLPESSRKFITCIRKYVLFYLKLLEETGDRCTLERAYISLRADKRFSLCIEDLVPVAIGRYVKALISTMQHSHTAISGTVSSSDHVLERLFTLFMEQGSLWPEICSLPEIKSSDTSESILYGYLHEHIVSLEKNGKLETLEAINEKIRKRFKNPKLSNSNCGKVCRHASVAWCRSLIYNLAHITQLSCRFSNENSVVNWTDGGTDNSQLLCVDLQTHELWSTAFEDPIHLKELETKWSPVLSKIKNAVIKKASDENLETANTLLRASYNFYRESSSVVLASGFNLYLIPSQLATEAQFHPSMNGIEALDLSIPRKLLLWAYVLLYGRYANISVVVKHCEEITKSKMKRGSGTSSSFSNSTVASPTLTGSGKDGANSVGCIDIDPTHVITAGSGSLSGSSTTNFVNSHPSSDEIQKNLFPQVHHCSTNVAERSNLMAHEADPENLTSSK